MVAILLVTAMPCTKKMRLSGSDVGLDVVEPLEAPVLVPVLVPVDAPVDAPVLALDSLVRFFQ